MKNLLYFLAAATGIYLLYRLLRPRNEELERHYQEQDDLADIATVAQRQAINAQPSLSYYGQLPLAGAQYDPFDEERPLRNMGFEFLPSNPVGKQGNGAPWMLWN